MKIKIINLLWGYKSGGVTEVVKRYASFSGKLLEIKTVIIQNVSNGHDFTSLENFDLDIVFFSDFFSFDWLKSLNLIIKDFKPSFILAHAFNAGIALSLHKILFSPAYQLICLYHGKYYAPTNNKIIVAPVFNYLNILSYKYLCRSVITVSDYSKSELLSAGIPEEKIRIIYNGIEADPDLRFPINFPNRRKSFVIGVISRLVPGKGLEYLIPAINQIDEAILLVIGDGPQLDILKLSVNFENKDGIHFVGNQTNIDSWLEFIDVLVQPSLFENHSIVILEGMRMGKPIIATNVGGNIESIRHELEGLLVPPANSQKLKEAIIFIKDNSVVAKELGANAKKRFIENFTTLKMKNQFEKLILELI